MGGGGGGGHFVGTVGGSVATALSGSTFYAAAANALVTGAGGVARKAPPAAQPVADRLTTPTPTQARVPVPQQLAPSQQWNIESAIEHLQRNSPNNTGVGSECARYVVNAIEAGGIQISRVLNNNPCGISAFGYGPVLESCGFSPLPAEVAPQAGDVVIIQPIPGHVHGHVAMYDGQHWRSDFRQDGGMCPNEAYSVAQPAYTIYRHP